MVDRYGKCHIPQMKLGLALHQCSVHRFTIISSFGLPEVACIYYLSLFERMCFRQCFLKRVKFFIFTVTTLNPTTRVLAKKLHVSETNLTSNLSRLPFDNTVVGL
jgi:hypothetical protein